MKTRDFVGLIALIFLLVIFFSLEKLDKNSSKEQISVEEELLSSAQRTDLVHFGGSWYVIVQNFKSERQLTLRDPRDNSTNTYRYSIIIGFDDFKVCSNPNPNNAYTKTVLKYFVGVY